MMCAARPWPLFPGFAGGWLMDVHGTPKGPHYYPMLRGLLTRMQGLPPERHLPARSRERVRLALREADNPGPMLSEVPCRHETRTFAGRGLERQRRPFGESSVFPGGSSWIVSRWLRMNRLAAMEAFVRVVETGSFSAAARQLHVGQPAVSKTVAQLEERLGVQLLLRSTQRLTPTEAGQNLYERAKHAIEAVEEAELAARGASASLSGTLRAGAAVTFARLHVIPRLPAFLDRHPGLTVDLVLDDRNNDLIESGIDVALRMGSLEDSALVARKIGQVPRLVVATPAYLEKHGEPASPAGLLAHQVIVYDTRGGGSEWTFRKGATESPVTLGGRLRINAAEGVREAVLAGMGLAVASEWMFAPELQSGAVRAVLRDWTLPPIAIWAVFPGRRASAKARAFATFVEEALAGVDSGRE